MTLNLAAQLIRRLATDPVFRHQLNALEPAAKRAFLDASGFRGVTSEWLHSVAHSTFGDLTADNVAPEEAMLAVTTAATASVAVPASASLVPITTTPQAMHPASAGLVPVTAAPQAMHPASAGLVPVTAAPQAMHPASAGLVPVTAAPQGFVPGTAAQAPAATPQEPPPPAAAPDTKPSSKK